MRLGKPREGLSLLGLLEPFVSSTSGRIMLRRWLHQPSAMAMSREGAEEKQRGKHCEAGKLFESFFDFFSFFCSVPRNKRVPHCEEVGMSSC